MYPCNGDIIAKSDGTDYLKGGDGMRLLEHTVTAEQDGRTVESLLKREFHMAPSLIARVKLRDGGITLNGAPVHTNIRVRAGEVLAADVSDIDPCNPARPADIPLDIVYEDEDLTILNKPAGMAVHGAPESGADTVANALAALWGRDAAFHPVNRLDRGTSGLMTAAKSGYIHDRLRRMLHTDAFRREYIAAAEGHVEPPRGIIELPIAAEAGEGGRRQAAPGGLPCRTDYEALDFAGGATLLRVTPLTGRTHQIRVHFSALGHPLCGDELYGGGTSLISRPALHSARIVLTHPVTGRVIDVSAPLPEDMLSLAETLGFQAPERPGRGG